MLAQKFIDFMLSAHFQEDMPLQMFMYPIDPGAKLPEEFTKFAATAREPAQMDPQTIASNRDKWIRAWSQVMLP